jgi:serine/threonine protein kinase
MAAAVVHPTDEALQAYGLGKLNDQAAEAVSRHLDGCAECQRRVAGLSSDSFLGRLRQAENPGDAARGRTAPVGPPAPGHAALPADKPRAGKIPPELASNADYEIVRELSGGGMGLLFLAHNHIMGRYEVLKIMGPEIIERPGVHDRFLREIRAVARLRHPNIVTAYTAFHAGSSLVFAMEYVDGLDLARMVKAKGPMPIGHACYFVHQAALGLQHAHEAGMVHRDIKPGNLMLTHGGGRAAIKVLDFGLAKVGREEGVLDISPHGAGRQPRVAGDLTLAGQMLGTPDFIAPEQIADARSADIRADIYSLGCTLYYLLSGRPPFQAAKLADVLTGHHSVDAMPLNLARPEVPVELAGLVAKMMAKKPDRRFQGPSEVAKALAPYFKKRSALAASPAFVALPTVAPDAGRGAAGPIAPEPQTVGPAAAAPEPAMWSSLIELKETEEDSAGLASAAKLVRKRPRWFRLAVAAALGLAAILLVAVIIFLMKVPFKTINGPPERLVTREEGAAPTGKAASDELKPEPRDMQVPAPPALPDIPGTRQKDPTVADSPSKAPPRSAAKPEKTLTRSLPPQKAAPLFPKAQPIVAAPTFGDRVEKAVRDGVQFLSAQQQRDGSWTDVNNDSRTGVTSLVALALLTAGEKPDSPAVSKALGYLRKFGPEDINNTYAISLQTLAYAAAEPARDQLRIAADVNWLERAQIKRGNQQRWPGSWTYNDPNLGHPGDSSNTQYALVALSAASEVGVHARPEVWALARYYWENSQKRDGSWAYTPEVNSSTASMTCAGISSLILSGRRRFEGQEFLQGEIIRDCGKSAANRHLQNGIDWLARNFHVDQNPGGGQQWKFYYLYGLERAGRLAGIESFGQHDWFRRGAEELVRQQNKLSGHWEGVDIEKNRLLATSFALQFLAKGRAPVLISKLRHGPAGDWNNDPDDVRNIVEIVAGDWKHLLTWQIVDPAVATVPELLQAPIVCLNGHRPPEFSSTAKQNLRQFVEQGGFIFAEACCGSREFDQGFKQLMKEIFAEEQYRLRPLENDHPVWRGKHLLDPNTHPLWGIEYGCRTVVIYSPVDLSCYWNQSEHARAHPSVIKAIKIGQNIIEYATGGALPADKLATREIRESKGEAPAQGAYKIARLKHAGDATIAPQAISNLTEFFRKPPASFDIRISQHELSPRDPNLVHYPLTYLHGRDGFQLSQDDLVALRGYLNPGGGTIFADAGCGSPAFDAAFRRFVAELLPGSQLVPIPREDELYSAKVGFDLSDVNFSVAAGGGHGPPQLEGVKLNNRWTIIYSKFDVGCALDRHVIIDCKGYSHESALKIAANIVIYSKLP